MISSFLWIDVYFCSSFYHKGVESNSRDPRLLNMADLKTMLYNRLSRTFKSIFVLKLSIPNSVEWSTPQYMATWNSHPLEERWNGNPKYLLSHWSTVLFPGSQRIQGEDSAFEYSLRWCWPTFWMIFWLLILEAWADNLFFGHIRLLVI